jgi:phosphoglycerate dehydrogenase-like enzyme
MMFLRIMVVGASVVLMSCAPSAGTREKGSSGTADLAAIRHATVAIEGSQITEPLVYFARDMAPDRLEALAREVPSVRIVAGLSRDQALIRAGEAFGADSFYATPEFLRAAKRLRWVQSRSAGVERVLAIPELRDRDEVVLTNFRAVHGPVIADHVFGLLLTLTRDLAAANDAKRDGKWVREPKLERIGLEGRTMLVVGLGGIGTEIARRASGFGMRVIATRRGDDRAPDFVERVGKPNELLAMLPEADVVAIAVPLTSETQGMFGPEAFAAMRKGSYLINIARGQVVSTDALVEALQSGHLGGAGLDVTDPEPLPAGHVLWSLPNVVITAHVAGDAELTDQRAGAIELENLRRFGAGDPLLNVVDKKAGY